MIDFITYVKLVETCWGDIRLQIFLYVFTRFPPIFTVRVKKYIDTAADNFQETLCLIGFGSVYKPSNHYFHTLLLLSPSLWPAWPLSQLELLLWHSNLVVIKHQWNLSVLLMSQTLTLFFALMTMSWTSGAHLLD